MSESQQRIEHLADALASLPRVNSQEEFDELIDSHIAPEYWPLVPEALKLLNDELT